MPLARLKVEKLKKNIDMKSFLNFLGKNKLYTFVEVVGMAIALAFVVLIAAFVSAQLMRDSEVKGNNIYVSHSERMFIGCGTIKEQLEGRFAEVQGICRLFDTEIFGGIEMNMRYADTDDRADALIVDENFFQMLPYTLVEGSAENVLERKESVVISESFANIFSSNENPVGKTLEVSVDGNAVVLTVTGVFRDFRNSILRSPNIIWRIDQLQDLTDRIIRNGSGAVATFFKLAPNTNVEELASGMEKIIKEQDLIYKHGIFKEFHLMAFEDIVFSDNFAPAPFGNLINRNYLKLYFAAGLLLLVFAILNYISLTVAQIGFRAREMATRRLVGAQSWQIVLKYIAESFALTLVSFLLAILLAFIFAPYLGQFTGLGTISFEHVGLGEIMVMLVVICIVAFLSGLIPAIMVLKYQPIDVVRGTFEKEVRMGWGRVLMIVQNFVAVIALAMAIVMFVQINHMQNKPMGYERNNRIQVDGANCAADYCVDELCQLACVESVGWLEFEPMNMGTSGMSLKFNGEEFKFDMYYGDQTAFDILGFEVIRQNAESIEYGAWLPESQLTALGVDYDCTMLVPDDDYGLPVCGIIKDFSKEMPGMEEEGRWPIVPRVLIMDDPFDFRWLRQLVVLVSGDEDDAEQQIKEFYQHKGNMDIRVRTYNHIVEYLYTGYSSYVRLIFIFTLLTLLLSSLAMMAMSMYYAKQHARNTAIHKVMGCENRQIYLRTIVTFLKVVLVAVVMAIPCAYLIAQRWLEEYSYRIDNSFVYYICAALIVIVVAIFAISWQAVRLMNTNPIETLKSK